MASDPNLQNKTKNITIANMVHYLSKNTLTWS